MNRTLHTEPNRPTGFAARGIGTCAGRSIGGQRVMSAQAGDTAAS